MESRTIIVTKRARRQSGSAMVELCLLAPWIFFLFVGVMQAGFFSYALIAVQNAARAGAVRAAQDQYSQQSGTLNDQACIAAWYEMNLLPNIGQNGTVPTGCATLPAVMSVATKTLCGSKASGITGCNGAATTPSCSDCDGTPWWTGSAAAPSTPDKFAASEQVAVTYTTIKMIPIPGILPVQMTFTRVAEARIIQE